MGHPPNPRLLSMKEASNKRTSTCSAQKKQVESKRENMDESNMFKENIIKEMF